MSNSSLVVYTKLSPNYTAMNNKVNKKITIHHVCGNCSIETLGDIFAPTSRKASSNYGVGTDGRIGMYVEEKNRSWCSSSKNNDSQAITIEVANDGGAPEWHVSDKALEATIELCVDICKRNNIPELVYTGGTDGNLTLHEMFADTNCPGPYLKSKIPHIVAEVNKRLGKVEYKMFVKIDVKDKEQAEKLIKLLKNAEIVEVEEQKPAPVPTPAPAPAPAKPSLDEIARAVINGDYGNGHATREANLKAAGMLEHYTYQQIRKRVNELYA